ncbi:MAG: phosphate signaling complex protein PhoU [Deltaproteobacteria bacterium]|nr:phosphate signaling complex protein PhoU [Deltaproteobacteria bacterium]
MERMHFQHELESLKMLVFKMAAASLSATRKAIESYMSSDTGLAETIVSGDAEINCMDIEIDRRSLRLLALEQPMAGDLRLIIGAMKIGNELERIADQAVNISNRAAFFCNRPPLPPVPDIEKLINVSTLMLEKAISSMTKMDVELAMEVVKMDDQADKYTLNVLKTVIEMVISDSPDRITRRNRMEHAIQTVIVSRCLERISDLSTNICEHVAFISRGVYIKHQSVDCDRG